MLLVQLARVVIVMVRIRASCAEVVDEKPTALRE
jgi:hypothetical protein